MIDLTKIPRRRYIESLTPMYHCSRLSERFNEVDIYMKRDDLLEMGGGGNKIRKLEFVVADAVHAGADTLITTGAVQSNHCRLTLAAAVREGLKCRLILEERVPGSYRPEACGNNLLFSLMNVEKIKVVPQGEDIPGIMEEERKALEKEGRKGYVIPGGASNRLGALGYVSCFNEILHQSYMDHLRFDSIVCASGSGGTHSGLLVASKATGSGIPIIGINVGRKREEQRQRINGLTSEIIEFLKLNCTISTEDIICFDEYLGEGYSLPTEKTIQAITTLAQTEAIFLEPVYTGKAFSGLLDLLERGYFSRGSKVLFIHTGGDHSLHAYAHMFFRNVASS